MKAYGVTFFTVLLVAAFLLTCAGIKGVVPIPLPWCVLIGLGVPAALALWYHRRKLSKLI